ncbi:MAG: M56 family metallopeptidase, partial [Acidobacteriota bacterium]|nr:M56 family metallopeptidase [Acidobacteriota bacterium]
MRFLQTLLASPAIQVLGWILLHSLWQGMVLAIFLKGGLSLSGKLSANARYLIACLTLMLMLILPVSTALWSDSGIFNTVSGKSVSQNAETNEKFTATFEPLAQANIYPAENSQNSWLPQAERQFLPVLVLLWLAGVFISSLKLLGIWSYTQRLRLTGKEIVSEFRQENLLKLCRQMRVTKPVILLESQLVKVPTVIGWLKPVILIPSCALTGLTPQQFELILAHELAHIRRYDYLINLIQTIFETLLFYHPAVWWVSSQIRNERENACDDLAVNVGGDAAVYARALIEMERLRKANPSLAMAADGGSLTERIHRLVGIEASDSKRSAGVWMVIMLCTFIATVAANNQKYSPIEEPVINEQLLNSPSSSDSELKESAIAGSAPEVARENRKGNKSSEESANNLQDSAEVERQAVETEDLDEVAENQQENKAASSQDDSKDFIAEMASVGYTNLSVSDLVSLKEGDVTAEYVRSLNAVGFTHLTVKELWRLGINEVKPSYIRAI